MSTSSSKENLKALVDHGLDIANIEFTKVGESYFANIYSELHSTIITSTVYTGFSSRPDEALAKALSELVERRAFEDGYAQGLIICNTPRSDGFAVLPRDYAEPSIVLARVRENALNEATERYAWASWWDEKTAAEIEICSYENLISEYDSSVGDLLRELRLFCDFEKAYRITPKLCSDGASVIIFFIPMKNGGFLSGGACDSNPANAAVRGISELFRHGLAWHKSKSQNLTAKTFYEKRLIHFASGAGDKLVLDTIKQSSKSNKEIKLPSLLFDDEVPHQFSSLYVCYRCLYKDQPPFGDGLLERLCL